MNWTRHPDPETRHRARRVAQLVLVLDMKMVVDAPDDGDLVDLADPIELVRRKRAWFVRAAHDDEPWNELARQLGWDKPNDRTGHDSMPSAPTLQLARETIDAQCHILFRIDTAHMAAGT